MGTRLTKDKLNKIFIDKVDSEVDSNIKMSSSREKIGISFTECENGYYIHSSHPVPQGFKKPVFRVGCNNCDICYNEKLQRKQLKWIKRISAMVEEYEKNKGMSQWHVVTMSPEDYVPLDSFKSQISRMIEALQKELKRKKDFTVKYVVTFEGMFSERNRHGNPGDDVRLHANIIFYLDTNNPDDYTFVEEYCKRYWSDHNFRVHPEKGYNVSRVFTAGVGGYIAKYISKESQTTRIMSSHFGWTKFMKAYDRHWLGLQEDQKVRRWAVWDGSRLKQLRKIVNDSKRSKEPIRMRDADMLKLLSAPERLFDVEKSVASGRFLTLQDLRSFS